jgi:3',5'-cyclic AMP phosphodiesterase CpdA
MKFVAVKRTYFFNAAIALLLAIVFALSSCGGNAADEPYTLIAAGDIAQCDIGLPKDSNAFKTANLVERLLAQSGDRAAVLTLGDNVYYTGHLQEFQSCYEGTWGKFKSRTWAIPGNHDYGVANAAGYFDYFGTRAGANRSGFYKQDLGKWNLLAMNSNIASDANSNQMSWLKAELAANSGCKLAAWHYPVISSSTRGNNSTMQTIWTELAAKKVDIVLQGHEHLYERFAPMQSDGSVDAANGIRSFVVGTGGASLYDFGATKPNSEARIRDFGVLVLKLYSSRYEWSFHTIDGATLDGGSANCKT